MQKRTYSNRKITFILVLLVSLIFIIPIISADTSQKIEITLGFYGPNWDITHDGTTNYLDVSSLVSHYSDIVPPRPPRNNEDDRWDITGDGKVNYLDVSSLVSHYGEKWLVSSLDDAQTQPSHTNFMGAVAEATAIASSIIYNSANISFPLIALFVFVLSTSLLRTKKRRSV